MDASIVLAVLVCVWAIWFFGVSWFIPPRECPQLASLSAAFRADRRAEILEELRVAARERDAAYKAALKMVESGELNHLDQSSVQRHAHHLREFNEFSDRVVELYGQLADCK